MVYKCEIYTANSKTVVVSICEAAYDGRVENFCLPCSSSHRAATSSVGSTVCLCTVCLSPAS